MQAEARAHADDRRHPRQRAARPARRGDPRDDPGDGLTLSSRVAVVGGSIAGCAAAIALTRAGCRVEVFERSAQGLRDRGSGLLMPIPLRDTLVAAGYLPAGYPACRFDRRLWFLADGSPAGRLLWDQPGTAAPSNWGVLWRSLRANLGDAAYHAGRSLASFEDSGDGVDVVFGDGTTDRFDVLVGADGYRSAVRARLHPGSRPHYAGYILWRGNYPETRVTDRAFLDRAEGSMQSVAFDGGHSIAYMIPDFDDRTDPGHRRFNWGVYAPQPPGLDFTEPTSIAPGEVSQELYAHLDRLLAAAFPPELEALIRLSPLNEVSIQPIYDEVVDAYAVGRVVLVGDAGTVTRPHTGSGATKALQDALALERAACAASDWDGALRAYDEERVSAGVSLVEMGRRIGRAQVSETPPWSTMGPADFEAWTASMLAGERLYWWGAEHG